MMGWHIRKDISGDVPFWAGCLIGFGAVLAMIVRGLYDVAAHRHRAAR